jgi:hypothetical protein
MADGNVDSRPAADDRDLRPGGSAAADWSSATMARFRAAMRTSPEAQATFASLKTKAEKKDFVNQWAKTG